MTIEAFKPSGFGWTANIPGFGLLADDFKEPALNIWTYDAGSLEPALFGKNARVPLKPFAGTIGNAPAETGHHSVVPPRRVGGNLDIRDLAAGTILYLPVEVAGALFSVGDTHAAQGDGEVCGTAIESPMNVVLTLDLVKDARLKTPRFTTPGPVTRHLDAKGYEVTTGIGPDLMTGARQAVAQMVDLLGRPLRARPGRRLHAGFGVRRSAHQRDRRHAELGGVVLLPALRVRMTAAASTGRSGAAAPAATATAGPVLAVSGLGVAVRGEDGERPVVSDLTFTLARGETLCIAGESGSGKSMTALAIMRLLPEPAARIAGGRIRLGDIDLAALAESAMRRIRGDRIAMIFQEPMTSLNPVLSIGRQLIEAIEAHTGLGRAEARRRAVEALQAVRISEAESRLKQYPHELSGGMRQRVMIAMALALKPDVLIADEPTTALDVTVQGEVLELLRDLQREQGTSIILITHDMGVVAEMADRVIVMRNGRMVEQGKVADIFARPAGRLYARAARRRAAHRRRQGTPGLAARGRHRKAGAGRRGQRPHGPLRPQRRFLRQGRAAACTPLKGFAFRSPPTRRLRWSASPAAASRRPPRRWPAWCPMPATS